MKILLIAILMTQMGCSFVTSTAGSFIGNLGADLAYDKISKQLAEKEKANGKIQ